MTSSHTPRHETLADWFRAFYAASDDAMAHEAYTSFYTDDAKLVMGDRIGVGSRGMSRAFSAKQRVETIMTAQRRPFVRTWRHIRYCDRERTDCMPDILKLRTDMWTAISSRQHTYQYFTNPQLPNTVLLQGTVKYGFKNGGDGMVEWVAKAVFEGDGEQRKLGFYQVFLNAATK